MKRRPYLHLALLAFVSLVGSFPVLAQSWDTNTVNWTNPQTCTSGQPVANCPVTSFRIEHSAGAAAPWATLATVAAGGPFSYTHTGVGEGVHCYRVFAISATKGTGPASEAPCVQNTAPPPPPSGPPSAPSVTVTAGIVALADRAPVYSLAANGTLSTFYGLIPPGRKVGRVLASHAGAQFCEYDGTRAELWKAPPARVTLVAACRNSG